MNLSIVWSRFLRNHIVRYFSSNNKPKNHYESLGISSKCTQGEVKAAYYKLSMLHHPDKNQGNPESQQKFRDINAAYEVLGNVNSRKLYDRGIHLGSSSHIYEGRSEDKFYKSRHVRAKPPTSSGKVPIYDFDEWAKMHYGTTFQRQQENKRRSKNYQEYRQMEKENAKMEKFLLVFGFIFILCTFLASDRDYDDTSFVTRKNKTSQGE